MSVSVAINGFGRIGRLAFRAFLHDSDISCVAINDLTDTRTLAHLLRYDSVQGNLKEEVRTEGDKLMAGNQEAVILAERDPSKLPWADLGVDIVLECTGLFRTRETAGQHLEAGAKKVLISAPGKDPDLTVVLGVNDGEYDPDSHHIISNASCTTNCLAPVAKVLNDNFGLKRGLMTTIHAYTNDQRILDLPHKDLRRARAAALSMIPTSTGAAAAVALVLPELKGKLNGMAVRVPVPDGSLVDLVANLEKETTAEEINGKLRAAAEGPMKGYLVYTEEPIVSCDVVGNPASSIVDGLSTLVQGGNLVKVLSWYDNENGYASRLADLTRKVAASLA